MFKIQSSLFKLPYLTLSLYARFAYPKHEVLSMPALSPTMKEGKILKWLKKAGDKVEPGDAIAEIETDKATMAFEVQQKGFIAKTTTSEDFIALGEPVVVITKNADDAAQFKDYVFGATGASSEPQSTSAPTQAPSKPAEKPKAAKPAEEPKASKPAEEPKAAKPAGKSYPQHTYLQMPAVSPTMTEGKILKWRIQPGESFGVGDAIFSIETDKATIDYEATEKGFLAKVMVAENEALPVGQNVAVVVKSKDLVPKFADFSEGASSQVAQSAAQTPSAPPQAAQTTKQTQKTVKSSGERIFASPLAKTLANERGIDLSQITGSGPDGRIIKQDVEGYTPPKVETKQQQKVEIKEQQQVQEKKEVKTPAKPKGFVVPENPFENIPLSSMRKTIANRLSESKQTIPHYYVSSSIEMGATNALRNELNKNEKANGVKISINDIIIKAMALALRDYPNVNVQWVNNSVRRFKHSDISVAVAIEGGLITPIVFRAETLGLLDIARRTKDVAKRAKEGKLDPSEFTGGTTTVSNLGMFGINTVSSIINPPQATILGVGKTERKLLVAEEGSEQPYRIAEVMDIIASVDHRAVDGALTAQWINRIKLYLQNPTHMLL